MKNQSIMRITISSIIGIVIIFMFLLVTTDGLTRAGRGESYRSKSSSSSRSSSSYRSSSSSRSYSSGTSRRSSTSSSSRTYIPPYIPSHTSSGGTTGGTTGTTDSTATVSSENDWKYGLIGLAVIIGLIALAIYLIVKVLKKIFGGGQSKPAFDDTAPTQYEFNPALLEQIRKNDPDFSPDQFMNKAQGIAERLQNAWSDGGMMPVRNYVSQGVFNRFKLQLELMRENEGVVNKMDGFKVLKLSVKALSFSKSYQTLHATMHACARDITLAAGATPDETQKALASASKEDFYEIYSFTRKQGVKTNTSKDWLKGECPNCGYVPENFSENNKCGSCGSIYNSGEYDWVLSEITQQEEWKDDSARDIRGLAALEGKNLSLNREIIEDRASYLFWRWIYSRVQGSSTPLSRDATPDFLNGFGADKEDLTNIAVGSVDLNMVETIDNDAHAEVIVLWSAAFGKEEEPYHQEHRFTMKMPLAGNNPYGLADHSCDSCGAPLPESDTLKCQYCGNAIPAVVSDWLLIRVDEIDWESQ